MDEEKNAGVYHVGVKVVPYEERDMFRALPEDQQRTWDSPTGTQAEVGEETQYTVLLTAEQADGFRSASNSRYVEPVREERVLGAPTGEVVAAEPGVHWIDADTLTYIEANELAEQGYDGAGVMVFVGDTGCGPKVREVFGSRFVEGVNFTDGSPSDTTDRHGHGSATGYMSAPFQAMHCPLKVLGDSGSGSSAGIIKSFYHAAKYATEHPNVPVLYNGSFGGSSFALFQPYVDALAACTLAGVIFVFSAGNDGKYGISAPANTSSVNPLVISSIAFDKSVDKKASFSNHHETGTLSGPGVQEWGYDKDGNWRKWNGTSFSGPWMCAALAMALTVKKGLRRDSVIGAYKANGRDSSEPTSREGGGVVALRRVINKALPLPEPPKPQPPKPDPPKPEPSPEPALPEASYMKVPRLTEKTRLTSFTGKAKYGIYIPDSKEEK